MMVEENESPKKFILRASKDGLDQKAIAKQLQLNQVKLGYTRKSQAEFFKFIVKVIDEEKINF